MFHTSFKVTVPIECIHITSCLKRRKISFMKPFCEYKYLNLNNFSALELKIKADNSVNKRGYLYRQVVFRFENRGFRKSAVFEKCSFWKGAVFENRSFWKGTVFKRCSFVDLKPLLSRPFDLILLSTQLTLLKIIWTDFCIVYPFDSFQHHLT